MNSFTGKLWVLHQRKPIFIVAVFFLGFFQTLSAEKPGDDFLKFPERNKEIIEAESSKILNGDKSALTALVKLADRGDPIAQERLFILNFESKAGVSDPVKACKYGLMAYSFWRKQIRIRPDHSYQVALEAMKKKDYASALKNLRGSAFWGFGDASFQLAKLYLKGDQVEKNSDLAGKLVNHSLKFIDMAKKEAVLNECLANIRVISGAIDMHNMDQKDVIAEFDEKMIQSGGLLLQEGYLKNPIKKPTLQCRYELARDEYENVFIQCTRHGSAYSLSGKLSDGLLKPDSNLGKILWADMKEGVNKPEATGNKAPENVAEKDPESADQYDDDGENKTLQQENASEEEKKACFANIKIILSGVEMYNMDHEENPITTFDESMLEDDGLLGKDDYLKKPLKKACPECHYESDGDLCAYGKIRCTIHGCPY